MATRRYKESGLRKKSKNASMVESKLDAVDYRVLAVTVMFRKRYVSKQY
jgi:hypothetical protein